MRQFLLPLLVSLVVGIPTTLAVQWWLELDDTLGFGGPVFGLVAWACGLFAGLGAALTVWAVMRLRGGRK